MEFPNKKWAEKLKITRGEGFLKDMNDLHNSLPGLTLKDVGDKNGATREYIRQAYKKLFREPYTIIIIQRKALMLRNQLVNNLQKRNIVSRAERYKKGDSSTVLATDAEYKFYLRCQEMGFAIISHPKIVCDFIVNSHFVDVKTCRGHIKHSLSAKGSICKNQEYYAFSSSKKQFAKTDFYAFYICSEDFWFILPKSLIKNPVDFYIPVFDRECRGKNKYKEVQQYREAWNLLR